MLIEVKEEGRTQILICFGIGPPKMPRRFCIGLLKMHRRFRIGPPEMHRRGILMYPVYYLRKALKKQN